MEAFRYLANSEPRRGERRMSAARCLRKDSRAFMRVHRDTGWAPDNSDP